MQILHHLISVFLIICTYLNIVIGGDNDNNLEDEINDDINFYSFPIMDIHENIVSLDQYKGKISLVVNVASHCGYTDSHYSGLKLLQELFGDTGAFTVLAFPCNQFGKQEPGNHQQIYDFARNRMGANFPLFAKINVIDDDVPQAWRYLIEKSGQAPNWNFWKYLVDYNGKVLNAWGPATTPDQLYTEIQSAVEIAVEAKRKDGKTIKTNQATKKLKDEF